MISSLAIAAGAPVPEPTSQDVGLIAFILEHPAVAMLVIGALVAFIVYLWGEKKHVKTTLLAKLDESERLREEQRVNSQAEINHELKEMVGVQTKAMGQAVDKMEGIADTLRIEIGKVGDAAHSRINKVEKEVHGRVDDLGKEFFKLQGEHDNNMHTCPCRLLSGSDWEQIREHMDRRFTDGRRFYDKDAPMNEFFSRAIDVAAEQETELNNREE